VDSVKNGRHQASLSQVPFVISPSAAIEVESRVISMAVAQNGEHIALCHMGGDLLICDVDGRQVNLCEIEGRAGTVVASPAGGFIVGATEGNLHAVDAGGNIAWEYAVGGGVEYLQACAGGIACLDGGGKVHLLDSNGRAKSIIEGGSPQSLVFDQSGSNLAIISGDGSVRTYSPSGEMQLERQPRHDKGERITAACFDPTGHLVVARETLGLADQGEDEVEVEWWTPLGERVDIQGLDTRCTTLTAYSSGVLAGTFAGEVFLLDRAQERVDIWKSEYAINSLTCLGNDVLVASWFYLYRITFGGGKDGDEPTWQVEHPGIVDFVSLDKAQNILCLGGEDRNDYTGEEPVLILDPHSEPEWLDARGDDPWVQDLPVDETASPVGELDISDDYSELLTAEEQAQLAAGHGARLPSQDGVGDSAGGGGSGGTGEEVDLPIAVSVLGEGVADELLSDLTSELDDDDMVEVDEATSHEDLMAGLIEDVGAHRISPVADSGADRTVAVGDDGTAVVRLDGSDSYDPHERIQRWLWKDGRGEVIGEVVTIRVRLSSGKHRFELSVLDDDGVWTTDTTFITVQ
jgi:hypothetical protein